MNRCRPFFLGLILGVIPSVIVSAVALHGRDVYWQAKAFEHHAAVWKTHLPSNHMTFQWLDDYYFEEITKLRNALPEYTPAPTPKVTEEVERL